MLPRILPLALIAVLMVLPLKLSALIDGFPAIAQQFDREFGNHERPWATDLKTEAATTQPATTQGVEAAAGVGANATSTVAQSVAPPPATSSATAPATAPVAPPATLSLAAPTCNDPLLRQAITEQKEETAAHQSRIREAEAVLSATEARVGTQIQRLAAMKTEVQALMAQRSSLEEQDLTRLVSIYEAMKPRDAARILNDLDSDIVIDVLDRLAERRTAPILANMSDDKAREVTRLILQRRALPGDRRAAAAAATTTAVALPAAAPQRPTLTN